MDQFVEPSMRSRFVEDGYLHLERPAGRHAQRGAHSAKKLSAASVASRVP